MFHAKDEMPRDRWHHSGLMISLMATLMANGKVAKEDSTDTDVDSTSVEREKHHVVHRKRCRHRESAADWVQAW